MQAASMQAPPSPAADSVCWRTALYLGWENVHREGSSLAMFELAMECERRMKQYEGAIRKQFGDDYFEGTHRTFWAETDQTLRYMTFTAANF